jgi:hypothetical protein
MTAPSSRGDKIPAGISFLKAAINTEASRTTLLTSSFRAALSNQFRNQVAILWVVRSNFIACGPQDRHHFVWRALGLGSGNRFGSLQRCS